tara:strand:- start:40643 stop:41281 length:639 start_codon:yes stop_codon:yes gene_type:complete
MESPYNREYIFCLGWNRTGTRTFDQCLRLFNIKSAHWPGVKHLCAAWAEKNWSRFKHFVVTSPFDAFSDAPWCFPEVYRHLDDFFPNAKFVLTIRDEDKWISSYKNLYERHVENHSNLTEIPLISNTEEYGWIHPIIFEGCRIITGNEKIYKRIFNKHNDEVISHFQHRPEKLLVIDWEKNGSSWDTLAAFLEKDIPEQNFPWVKDKRKIYE